MENGPVGALCFMFDVERALRELPLVRAVAAATSIEAASDALAGLGVSTELDYERSRSRNA